MVLCANTRTWSQGMPSWRAPEVSTTWSPLTCADITRYTSLQHFCLHRRCDRHNHYKARMLRVRRHGCHRDHVLYQRQLTVRHSVAKPAQPHHTPLLVTSHCNVWEETLTRYHSPFTTIKYAQILKIPSQTTATHIHWVHLELHMQNRQSSTAAPPLHFGCQALKHFNKALTKHSALIKQHKLLWQSRT